MWEILLFPLFVLLLSGSIVEAIRLIAKDINNKNDESFLKTLSDVFTVFKVGSIILIFVGLLFLLSIEMFVNFS